jgi:HSP20 family molecular chaperone IbpA
MGGNIDKIFFHTCEEVTLNCRCDFSGASQGLKFDEAWDDENCTKRYIAKIPGKSESDVTITKKWVNREKALSLVVSVRDDEKNRTDCRNILIDTNVYDRYSYEVKHGVLTITLYEIINEQPKFELV